jgi:xanthine dehydrogenase accessory factor
LKELEDLVKGWRALPKGTPVVLATVVATSGSTYRKAGAKMLITGDIWVAGSVSGGCLESDLIQTAWTKTEDGPALLTFDATADEDILWGFGLGCNGTVQVFIERIDESGGPLAYFADRYDRREPGIVGTVLAPGLRFGEHLYLVPPPATADGSPHEVCELRTIDGLTVFLDSIAPPLDLIVFGAGHDALPVLALAKALGWRVTVVHKQTLALSAERFDYADELLACTPEAVANTVPVGENTAIVLMTHNYLQDRELLRFALGSEAFYVGVLGPKRRSDRLLDDLRDDGYVPSPAQLERLHAPIGLDLGAEGPDEIALAIVAEIQAFSKRRRPAPLRESTSPLHPQSRAAVHGELRITQCGLSA